MSSSKHKKEEGTMFRRRYKRILRSLTLALAIFALVPVGNAIASNMNGDHSGSAATQSSPIVSEKLAGLVSEVGMTDAEYRALMLRSEALNRKYGLGDYALTPVVSEITTGLGVPSQPETTVVATSGSDFDWSDASVGIAALFATLLVASGVVMTFRRHRSPLAH
jgi:hypothetical protein